MLDLTSAFRGSAAVDAGLVTPGVLRGRRYRRLFPDVYAPEALDPDLGLRARAAGVLVAGRGCWPDALAYCRGLDVAAVRMLRNRHLGARRGGAVAEVLALVDRRAESPMESRVRVALHLGGLPAPAVQHPVVARGTRYHLDLAYPHALRGTRRSDPLIADRARARSSAQR